MSARRLASLELRRLAVGRITRLALVAAALVPLLYGALSIYANWDPYQRLSSVPAAIVMADDGAVDADGRTLDAGAEVERQLVEAGDFDWRRVSPEEADLGVAAGRYGFALVVPPDFSSALIADVAVDPQTARLTVITNDANNHLVGTVAEQLAERVRSTVATQVGRETADRLLVRLNTVYEQTAASSDEAVELTEATGELIAAVVLAGELLDEAVESTAGEALAARSRAEQAVDLADAAGDSADAAGAVAADTTALEEGAATLRDLMRRVDDDIEAADGRSEEVSSSTAAAAAEAAELTAAGGLVAESTGEIAAGLPSVRDGLSEEFTRLGAAPEEVETLLAELDALTERSALVDEAATGLADALTGWTGTHESIQESAAAFSAAADALASSASAASGEVDELLAAGERVTTAAADLDADLTRLSEEAAEQREAQDDAAVEAETAADRVQTLVGGAVELLELTEGVDEAALDLADRLAQDAALIPTVDPAVRQAAAQAIASPVTVTDRAHLTAGSHGAGLAPLFLGLALWVGAVVSYLLLRPLSVRALAANVPAWRVALGGWLPAAALGLAQAVTLFIATVLVIGLPATRPWAVLGLLVVTALAFTGIAHALCAAFGPAGRFVALVALVLQLTTAGSVLPWLTMPEALHPLHRLLPLGYVVDGLRHLLYGGDAESALLAVLVCLCWLVLAFVVAVTAAMRRRVWTPGRLRPEVAW
ncbi:putative membrane protein [Actinoalloteichus hoggarensis]|uniref:Chromosome partition protein Smc n=1 Tax=Actinoalloteichus hoggarensis TaxID=1470176 RepID=A0A221W1P8_9PSEU|nr:YhgE/Pip family protein [Actinoalloteichus hoggarensis]ASO19639.1 Chromosome partition protein Smc [Actinoalloteichus hoggarensis]MBB5919654.1 putative membrane protein [Actinoalloteichus hoggarensis]